MEEARREKESYQLGRRLGFVVKTAGMYRAGWLTN